MYLAAQTVRSPRGLIGTNVVMYRHEGNAASIDWNAPDLRVIASVHPGTRVAEHVEVAPGGNAVMRYLDLAARDGTTREQIVAALDQLTPNVLVGTPCVAIAGPIAAEFRITMGESDRAPEHYRMLRGALLRLFDHPNEAAEVPDVRPLLIHVERNEQRLRFYLDERDRHRVPALITAVTVPLDVADDLRAMHGALEPHAAEWVTGLSREQILQNGGVEFVGAINRRWPN